MDHVTAFKFLLIQRECAIGNIATPKENLSSQEINRFFDEKIAGEITNRRNSALSENDMRDLSRLIFYTQSFFSGGRKKQDIVITVGKTNLFKVDVIQMQKGAYWPSSAYNVFITFNPAHTEYSKLVSVIDSFDNTLFRRRCADINIETVLLDRTPIKWFCRFFDSTENPPSSLKFDKEGIRVGAAYHNGIKSRRAVPSMVTDAFHVYKLALDWEESGCQTN
jgi:hypothetical protein